MRKEIIPLLLLCAPLFCLAQDPKIKFGKIAPEDIQKKVYTIDSNAHAVVLSDVGSTEIVGNTKGWFSFVFKRHKRVHILNKNGYDQADVEIPLYKDGNAEEKLENLKAATYNFENGKIVETRLEKSNVFTETISKKRVIKKFILPNVKEGSIIEIQYTIKSDFLFNLQPWTFQGSAPRLWSEYTLSVPQFLDYAFLSQGYHAFHLKDKKDRITNFSVSDATSAGATERYNFTSGVSDYRWVMKDVPQLREESFTSTLGNHIAKIEFQLAAFKDPLQFKNVMGTWTQLAKDLMADEDFGKSLDNANNWLGDVVKPLIQGATSDEDKAKRIFAYVRDNITCTSHSALYTSQTLKNVLKSRNGKVSEINLLLTAMLKYAGIAADPVILSTKDNGYTNAFYPILGRFNYIICRATIDGRPYVLDASRPRLGFGKLTPDCYNGHARTINTEATPLEFVSDSLQERKVTSVFILNDEKNSWLGNMKQAPGYFESYNIRARVKDKGKDEFFKQVKKDFGMDIELMDPVIDSLDRYEDPVALKYDFKLNVDNEDIIYLNPMFGEAYKENPFKSAERFYPVEMPYAFDETYIATIQVPLNYVVDELPKSIKVKFNEENEGLFEYLISQSGNTISMRSRVQLNRATFNPDEYDFLREFFNLIVSKQKEQIVFKKKS